MDAPTFCFTCGQSIEEPPRLNTLPDGEPCPACRLRALEAAPAILPSPAAAPDDRFPRETGVQGTLDFPPSDPDLGEPA